MHLRMDDWLTESATQLATRIRTKQALSETIVAVHIARAKQTQSAIHAVVRAPRTHPRAIAPHHTTVPNLARSARCHAHMQRTVRCALGSTLHSPMYVPVLLITFAVSEQKGGAAVQCAVRQPRPSSNGLHISSCVPSGQVPPSGFALQGGGSPPQQGVTQYCVTPHVARPQANGAAATGGVGQVAALSMKFVQIGPEAPPSLQFAVFENEPGTVHG